MTFSNSEKLSNFKVLGIYPNPTTGPHHTIKLQRKKIFKSGFPKCRFCRKSTNDAYGRGWGVILFTLLWRIAHENQYVTHPLLFQLISRILGQIKTVEFFMEILKIFPSTSTLFLQELVKFWWCSMFLFFEDFQPSNRSSLQGFSVKKGVLRNFAKFTGVPESLI